MADLVITIHMADDDKPDVTWPTADDCSGSEKKPCTARGRHVKWELAGELEGRAWAVVFAKGSPFRKGTEKQMVFHQTDARGLVGKEADAGEYKYDVVLADAQGNLTFRDPKIMVQEEVVEEDDLDAFAYRLEAWAAETEEVVAEARELAERTREVGA